MKAVLLDSTAPDDLAFIREFGPGLALFLAVTSVNLLGDRLRQVLDPRAAD